MHLERDDLAGINARLARRRKIKAAMARKPQSKQGVWSGRPRGCVVLSLDDHRRPRGKR